MNYDEIVDLALFYSDRPNDIEILDNIDHFIVMAESRINRELKTQKMAHRSTHLTLIDNDYYGLPGDFAGIRDIEIYSEGETTGKTLRPLSPEQMNSIQTIPGGVIYYSIIANQLQIKPRQDGKQIEIVYYRRVPKLTKTNNTNWLSLDNPDVYITGMLVEMTAFAKDYEAMSMWNSRFAEVVRQIDNDDQETRWSGTPLQIRTG